MPDPNDEQFDDLTDDQLLQEVRNDIDALVKMGLIEVKGITENGDWLYGVTDKSLNMSIEEITDIIMNGIKDDED